jgi:hypothetical protein
MMTTTFTNQTATDLLNAARLLRRGWAKHSYWRPGPWYAPWRRKHCAYGALIHAVNPKAVTLGELSWAQRDRVDRAARAVEFQVGAFSIITWNDRKDRTKDEVVAAFEGAASR